MALKNVDNADNQISLHIYLKKSLFIFYSTIDLNDQETAGLTGYARGTRK